MRRPNLVSTGDRDTDRNFTEVGKHFLELFDGCGAKLKSYDLVAGDNSLTPTVSRPTGRFVVFQSAAATLFDKGLSGDSWVINASAPCTVKLAFF